jgi:hypothetical protein
MPYKNVEDQRAQWRRWARANKEKARAKSAAYRERNRAKDNARAAAYRKKHKAEIREYFNERNFRFACRELTKIKAGFQFGHGYAVGTKGQIENPVFIFIHNGRRYTETFNDPLPWQP